MPGLGTIVNAAAVIAGGVLGLLFGKRINEKIRDSLTATLGLATMFVGVAGALAQMLRPGENGGTETYGTLMMIVSLVLGTLIGELLKLEDLLERFGDWLKKKVHAEKDAGFTAAFVNTSLIICVGAMAVVGAIQDGLTGDHTTLFAKALLDFLIVIILASTMGPGCIFAFLPIALLQGSVTALAHAAKPLLESGSVIADISLVGSVMICGVGVNLTFGKKFRMGNMLPALLVALIWSVVSMLLRR